MRVLVENDLRIVLDVEKYREKRERYVERMTNEGYSMYTPNENELCIDIDDKESLKRFHNFRQKMEDEFKTELDYKKIESTTPGHFHIILTMPFPIESHQERIALQLLLGSDPVRELLSLFRAYNGDPFPTLLAMKEEVK